MNIAIMQTDDYIQYPLLHPQSHWYAHHTICTCHIEQPSWVESLLLSLFSTAHKDIRADYPALFLSRTLLSLQDGVYQESSELLLTP